MRVAADLGANVNMAELQSFIKKVCKVKEAITRTNSTAKKAAANASQAQSLALIARILVSTQLIAGESQH